MTVLGVLDAIKPVDRVLSDPVSRPGTISAPTVAAQYKARGTQEERLAIAIEAAVEDSVDRAERAVAKEPTATALAALAQALGSDPEWSSRALRIAKEALEQALQLSPDGRILDPISARIASEVLLRHGEAEFAYRALRGLEMGASLTIAFAAIAASAGHTREARAAIQELDSPTAEAYRGYLAARDERWEVAVRHLREALKSEPDDVDSLLNLSISLWHLGSTRKATRAALHATRIAPGRKDVSLHYLELLLAQGLVDKVHAEIRTLHESGVIPDAQLRTVQARALLEEGKTGKAISVLQQASRLAAEEQNDVVRAEVEGNLIVLRWQQGRIAREEALGQLQSLMENYPSSAVAALKYAQVANRRSEAGPIEQALGRIPDLAPAYAAYLEHQLATLLGDSPRAAAAASEWFRLEPHNSGAAIAAIVSLGIGQEDWTGAAAIAEFALEKFPQDKYVVNNGAYVLAMAGDPKKAIRALESHGGDDFVLKATLGLAYLADGNIDLGMRLYRRAADEAEKLDSDWRSLMTAYQSLVIRQLRLDVSVPRDQIEALSLVPVNLPDDWKERSDFVRLHSLFEAHHYPWPPTPEGL
jgi:tetratricopeptide (TPR) repeat protein